MKYDIVVIGASFAGLSAAMQIARARKKVAIVDSGIPRNRFTPASHGFLGQDGNSPRTIMAEGLSELLNYPTVTYVEGEIIKAHKGSGVFSLQMKDHRSLTAARLVLATGVRDVLPDIPGLKSRWGTSVLHCPYCHGFEFSDRRLGVISSGSMSVHQALLVSDWGTVTYFTQDRYEPDFSALTRLEERGIKIERSPIVEINGTMKMLENVALVDGRKLPIDAMFLAPTTELASDLAVQLGCTIETTGVGQIIKVDDGQATSEKGVYAAGDATSTKWNATIAAASGVLAGVSAHQSSVFRD